MIIQVEFLIRAHDCYTLGCSVGGIADLLVTAQSTTKKLVAGKHFKLMVRIAYFSLWYLLSNDYCKMGCSATCISIECVDTCQRDRARGERRKGSRKGREGEREREKERERERICCLCTTYLSLSCVDHHAASNVVGLEG